MKVKELIEKLKEFDPEWDCFTDTEQVTISLFFDEERKRVYIETQDFRCEECD